MSTPSYQTKQGSLYIGTSGSGVLIYDPQTKLFTHYYTGNCAMISNNIYTILSDEDNEILLSTENGLTSFYTQTKNLLQLDKGNGTDDYALQCVVRYPAQK